MVPSQLPALQSNAGDRNAIPVIRVTIEMIRYYVVRNAKGYEVRREGVGKGIHRLEARALQAARFMATVESTRLGTPCELFLELLPGQFHPMENFRVEDQADLPYPVIEVGCEAVLLK